MTELRFTLNIVPPTATAQGKGVRVVDGKPCFFTKARQKQDTAFLTALLLPHVPATAFASPVFVFIGWRFPWRKADRPAMRMWGPSPHGTKPDLDNLEKSLLDAMTRLGFWSDDGLVARKLTEKLRADAPAIEIAIMNFHQSPAFLLERSTYV